MLNRIAAIIYKEYLHISRDSIALVMLIFFPVFALFLFGVAINLDIKNISLAVYDLDASSDSRALAEKFIQSGYFDLKYHLYNEENINRIVDAGMAKALLRFPEDFSQDIQSGKGTAVQLIIDAADNNTANIIMGYANAIIPQFSREMLDEFLASQGMSFPAHLPSVDLRPNIWYNPELKSNFFLIPGLIGMLLMSITVIRTSITIVREKERGTMESLLVTPIKPIELMIGKITPYIIISFIILALIYLLARVVFQVPFRGSHVTFFGLSGLFVAATLGIGLFISNVADTAQTAWLMGFLSSILPAIILSGFIFPIESMPYPIQQITYLFPIRYFIVILRSITLKGVGLTTLYPEALVLLTFAIAVITTSALRFKKKVG